jgi:ABC-2 type transport system ATP-binding protein
MAKDGSWRKLSDRPAAAVPPCRKLAEAGSRVVVPFVTASAVRLRFLLGIAWFTPPGTFPHPPASTPSMTGEGVPVLEAQCLTKRYGAVTAVQEVSFAIHAGEILGLLGPNGAGKSTIVKMITALLDPSRGAVLFQGHRIDSDLTSYKQRLGYVPEQPDLYQFLTGWEYLEMVATLRGLDRRRFREKAAAMLRAFTLYSSRDALIGSYSKGMRQRIVLISALMHDPGLLILDEPFSGLDVTSALVLRRVIARLAAGGKAVLFSSPVLEQADRLCTHLVLLKRGTVVSSGTMDEMHAGFAGLGLEHGFMQLTEQVDADRIAQDIVSAVRA